MRNTQIIEAELKPGEQIIWSNQPKGIVRFRFSDIFLIVFCLIMIKSGIDFVIDSFSAPTSQPVARILMILAYCGFISVLTLGLAHLRIRVETEIREHTDYVVTDKRILIVSNPPKSKKPKIKSVFFGKSFQIALKPEKNGEGSIAFGANRYPPIYMGPLLKPQGAREITPIFEWIENVQGVYDIIKIAQEKAS